MSKFEKMKVSPEFSAKTSSEKKFWFLFLAKKLNEFFLLFQF